MRKDTVQSFLCTNNKTGSVKMLIFSKLIYRFNAIPIKIPARLFFIDIDKILLKFMWKGKRTQFIKRIK